MNKLIFALMCLFPFSSWAESLDAPEMKASFPTMLTHPAAWLAIVIFLVCYVFVFIEEKTELRKSKPVLIGAGLIWALVAWANFDLGIDPEELHNAVGSTIEEYGSLFLFLLAAMTYISALEERQVFESLRSRLVRAAYSDRQLFWITGAIAFALSPLADNMTTSLVMGSVILSLAGDNKRFLTLGFINVVNGANAGGAFSPFGDITTLMVWQSGHVQFLDFLPLFLPSLACFLVPAFILSFFVPKEKPAPIILDVPMKIGSKRIIALGFLTIGLAILFEQVFSLPAFLGMMLGLGMLLTFGYFLKKEARLREDDFDVFRLMDDTEWDTMLFFFGIIFCISGLSYLGYLEVASGYLYEGFGPGPVNILIGIFSAGFDNIPLMFAVLSMRPEMDLFHWQLLTLTLGVGGSLLAIGSAAGVALMGMSKGKYTFLQHLRWTPVLLLGYAAAILVHYAVNG